MLEVALAVNVTICPITEGFPLEDFTVVVAAGFTVSTRFDEVLPVKLVSPAYRAEIACVPALEDPPASVNCAVPDETLAEPICALPSKKATFPVGLPLVGSRGSWRQKSSKKTGQSGSKVGAGARLGGVT